VDRFYSPWLISDGKECQRLQNAEKFLVAATFEKANTYVFAELAIMNYHPGNNASFAMVAMGVVMPAKRLHTSNQLNANLNYLEEFERSHAASMT